LADFRKTLIKLQQNIFFEFRPKSIGLSRQAVSASSYNPSKGFGNVLKNPL
jgi:hypothetical protein